MQLLNISITNGKHATTNDSYKHLFRCQGPLRCKVSCRSGTCFCLTTKQHPRMKQFNPWKPLPFAVGQSSNVSCFPFVALPPDSNVPLDSDQIPSPGTTFLGLHCHIHYTHPILRFISWRENTCSRLQHNVAANSCTCMFLYTAAA